MPAARQPLASRSPQTSWFNVQLGTSGVQPEGSGCYLKKSRKLLFPVSTRWRIVAPGPALGTGRSRRGHGSAAGYSGPGSLTERLSARRPFPVLCTGWVALTAEQSACRGRQLGVLAWATSTSPRLTAGSRPLCLRAVVCCPAPSSACALRGRRHPWLEVLPRVEIMRICSKEP